MTAQKTDILAQRLGLPGLVRRAFFGLLVLLVPALTVVTAFGIVPGTAPADVELSLVREPIDLPEPAAAPTEQPARFVSQERVLRGDTVAALFDRLGASDPKAIEFLKGDATGRLIFRQLVPGRMLQAETGLDGQLLALRYFMSPSALLEVVRTPAGLRANQRALTETPRLVYKTATIRCSPPPTRRGYPMRSPSRSRACSRRTSISTPTCARATPSASSTK
jgi:hypothetical protein